MESTKLDSRFFRIIAKLDIKNENLIKGIHLEGLRVIGDPNEFAKKYYNDGVDEIFYHDSVASLYGRNSLEKVLSKTIEKVFVPITVGGGIRSEKDAMRLFSNGADKISINSAAVKNPNIINKLFKKLGSQSVVVTIEAKKTSDNLWEVYIENGREKTGICVFDWIKKIIDLGAGEIILTSIDKEGTKRGPDLELVEKVSRISTIPFIYCGGFGNIDHIIQLVKNSNVDGVALASVLHYGKLEINEIKNKLKTFVNIRLDY
jgi:cyclase